MGGGLAGRDEVGLHRGGSHYSAAESFDETDRIPRHAGRLQSLSFERLCCRAEPVLYQPDAVIKLGRPRLTPQGDFGGALIKGLHDTLPDP